MTREDRKKKRQKLAERQKKNVEQRDSKGGVTGKRYASFPEGTEFYKTEVGNNKISIVPYEIETNNHPGNDLKKGDLDYLLDIHVHSFIGLNGDSFLCPKKNYGKPCPICEENQKLYDEGDTDSAKKLLPKRRAIYNVIDEKDGKNKVFDVSHFLFEKEMMEKIAALEEDNEVVNPSDEEDGNIIKFRATEKKATGYSFQEYKDFTFLDREPLEEEDIDAALNLDKYLVIPKYDEMYVSLHGESPNDSDDEENEVVEEEVEERPRKSKRRKTEEVDESDDLAKHKKEMKKNRKKKRPVCPDDDMTFGQDFGVDSDFCDDCDFREECEEKTDEYEDEE
ncbi:MAG: hypothetical protein GY679_02110 [Mycoplasma sp.]|nr:hypothetical protein [Mycoplasma sp.]